MRNDPVAEALFGSETLPRLLATLLSNPGTQFSFGELQDLLGATRDSLQRALGRALRARVITRQLIAGRFAYCADTHSPIYPDLKNVMSHLGGPANWLRQRLEPLKGRVEAAFIYGSVAAARDDHRSDLDLFVIGDLSSFQVDELLLGARDAIGRDLNLVVYPRDTVLIRLAEQHPFFTEVFVGPKLMVVGEAGSLPEVPLLVPR